MHRPLSHQHLSEHFSGSTRFFYILIDQQGMVVAVNPLSRQRFGFLSPLTNYPVKDLFAPDSMTTYQGLADQCVKEVSKCFDVELEVKTNDGPATKVRWEFSAVIDAAGELVIQGIGTEVEPIPTRGKTAEQHLQESELFYRNLFANSLDGVLITDEKGRITFASASVTTILGYPIEELLDKNVFDYAHPDDHAVAYSSFMDEVFQQPQKKFISIRLLKNSGDWIWCNVRGHNLMENPYIKGMIIYFSDDSLRKQAEDALSESEQRFRNMIYNLSQGVILQNAMGEVIVINRAAQLMLGVNESEIVGFKSLDPEWNIIREDGHKFPPQEYPVREAMQTKKPVRDIIMGLYSPGKNDPLWLLVNADPVLDKEGNIFNIICSFIDITEQKRLSHELIEQEIQKQRQLTQATIDGQEKERLEIGKELHDNISQHLTTTKLYLEVGREKAVGDVLKMIRLAHSNLSEIIDEIRHLSQSLVPPTLGDLGMIESVVDLCDSLRRAHLFRIEFHHRHFNEENLPDNLKLMLFRIIQELVNNIVRHAHADRIRIRLLSDAENIVLTISDNGIGFDPTDYHKGLGITNITNRTNLFNGKVEIDSAPGEGCTMTVQIPLPLPVSILAI